MDVTYWIKVIGQSLFKEWEAGGVCRKRWIQFPGRDTDLLRVHGSAPGGATENEQAPIRESFDGWVPSPGFEHNIVAGVPIAVGVGAVAG